MTAKTNGKRGRPPKRARDRHSVVYIVRLQPEQAALLEAEVRRRKATGASGATPAALIRELALAALPGR